jgi:PPM family protein phosphatase
MSNTQFDQPAIRTFSLTSGAVSETGRRDENQDRMTAFQCPHGSVYLVADGMGGHNGGSEAASIVAEGFHQCLSETRDSIPLDAALAAAARTTHQRVLSVSQSGNPSFAGMGSTVVMAIFRQGPSGRELITAHMGDSRAYLHRSGQLLLLTKDHTQVQRLIDGRLIDEETARTHPDAGTLTRAMGHGDDPALDVSSPVALMDGDGVLICSDGLSGFTSASEIDQTVKHFPNPASCVQELVRLALERNSNDNITVQFVRVGTSPQPVLPPPRQSRKTAPEMLAAPLHAPDRPRLRVAGPRRLALASVAGILLAAGGAFAVHSWSSARAGDAAPSPIDGRIRTLEKRTSILETQAAAGENDAAQAIQGLGGIVKLPRNQKQARARLKEDFERNRMEFLAVMEYVRGTASLFRSFEWKSHKLS